MNKLKFLYDVVKNLKGKEILNGVAVVNVQKDQQKIFYVKNEFQKNLLTMQTKASIHTEIDYEGQEVKHQSTTEFINSCCSPEMRGQRGFRHSMRNSCGGIKAKLTKLAFVLNLLNDMQVAEQENGTILVTLEIPRLPEEFKTLLQEKANHGARDHHPCCFAKELCSIKSGNFSSAMTVNQEFEIEKIVITFDGIQHDEQNEQHEVNIVAELQLLEAEDHC